MKKLKLKYIIITCSIIGIFLVTLMFLPNSIDYSKVNKRIADLNKSANEVKAQYYSEPGYVSLNFRKDGTYVNQIWIIIHRNGISMRENVGDSKENEVELNEDTQKYIVEFIQEKSNDSTSSHAQFILSNNPRYYFQGLIRSF